MHSSRSLRFAGWIAVAITSAVAAQCPPAAWFSMNPTSGLNGTVRAATTWDPDGPGPSGPVLAVAGFFTIAGGVPANRVAIWDGAAFQPLGTGLNGGVWALTVFNGDLIAGGTFTIPGGTGSVARWNGSSWVGLAYPGGDVVCLSVFNGDLIAGGNFYGVLNRVARWDGFTWQPLGTGVSGITSNIMVSSLTVFNGSLIAGGTFTSAGGTVAPGIAGWNGSSWFPLGTGVGGSQNPFAGNGVRAMTVSNGQLVAGGSFTFAGGVAANNIASWNGSAWQPLGAGVGGVVSALTKFNGMIVVGGTFPTAGGFSADNIAGWNGSSWVPPGVGANGAVLALEVYGGWPYAGGAFTSVGGTAANYLAAWIGSGWVGLGAGLDQAVRAFSVQDGFLVAGGSFTTAGAVVANRVARWDGSTWFSLGGGMNGVVLALARYNGEIVAAGSFSTAGGVAAANVARWNGSAWMPLGTGLNGTADALHVWGGDLIAGGSFTVAGGVGANSVARWNGSAWQPLGSGTDSVVYALTDYAGDLIAGGLFTMADGMPASRIARWDGSAWHALGAGVPGPVNAMTTHAGQLVVAGGFYPVSAWDGSTWQTLGALNAVSALTAYAGEIVAAATSSIARWDGAAWQPLGAGLDASGLALAVYDGALIVGGGFSTAGGIVSPFAARWSPPLPLLSSSQPAGPGTGVQIANRWLVPGREYLNLYSFDLCPSGPASGPYGGLCFNDPSALVQQLLVPVGTPPFHFAATSSEQMFGPYAVPVGAVFEAVSVDVTGGAVGCVSQAFQFAVQ